LGPNVSYHFAGPQRGVGRFFRALAVRLLLLVWPRAAVDGVRVYDLTFTKGAREDYLARLRAALRLIRETSPAVHAGLVSRLRKAVIVEAGGPEYVHPVRGCLLSGVHVQEASKEELALILIHESTHARIWNRGVPYRPEYRERIERLCVAAETNWARKLPDGPSIVRFAEAKLTRPWWSPEAELERHQRQLKRLRDAR
jgi:hypothetical protein